MNEKTLKRALTALYVALMLRRRRRDIERGWLVLKWGALLLSLAATVVILVVWNKRRRGQVEEAPAGRKPVEGLGTQTTG